MDAVNRYLRAHFAMTEYGIRIRPQILRDYLDALRMARATAPGLHNTTIVVTHDSSPEMLDLFNEVAFDTRNVFLDVRS